MFQRVTFASRARLGNGKNANFRLLCSTKTQVENQAPTEQNAWPDRFLRQKFIKLAPHCTVVLLCMMLLVTAVQLKKFYCRSPVQKQVVF